MDEGGQSPVEFAVTFTVNGEELRCTSLGSGPVVVLLHAGGERRRVWRPVAELVAPHGFRVISVDQRGHGDSQAVVSSRLDDYAADLQGLLGWLDVPVVLVGASLGGLASLLAVADPPTRGRVNGLVLVDVRPDPDPARARSFLRGLENEGSPSGGPNWNWALIDDILSMSPRLRAAAAALRVPVTLVRGANSPVLSKGDALGFQELVGHAVVREVHGAGHLVARDRPTELADVLLDHLERQRL